jgi:hypothetical protein
MSKTTKVCMAVLAIGLAGCSAGEAGSSVGDDVTSVGTVEQALSTCGRTPSDPCYQWQCIDGFWEAVDTNPGAVCQTTGYCSASGVCIMPPPPPAITSPAIDNIFMYSPSQTSFYQTCATGSTATTTTLNVSIDGAAWFTLPNTCAYFGSGQRYDSYNVGPGQSRCYVTVRASTSGRA